jgi:hypothetical protein
MMDRLARLLALFPRLHGATFRITSPPDDGYNCMSWCAEDVAHWWWPLGDHPELYWPDGVAKEVTVAAFQAAFATLGFADCPSEHLEAGTEKIAIFAKHGTVPTHGARQLPSGLWTSKFGKAEDVEHPLRELEGDLYGTVALVLGRPRPAPGNVTPIAPAAPAS